jgi:hypothetical protein
MTVQADAAPATLAPPPSPTSSGGIGGRLAVALILIAFLAGIGFMGLVMSRHGDHAGDAPAALADNGVAPTVTDPLATTPTAPPDAALTGSGPVQAARVAELEQRLTRIAVAAQSASGYAHRAEALLIAFAARRALDAGQPLNYVEQQLRLRFGDDQPRAVATIVNAAREPVTLPDLRAGLDKVQLASVAPAPAERGLWQSIGAVFGDLAKVRRASAPPPGTAMRLSSARLNVESGRIDAAIADVSALPLQPPTAAWLEKARRYNEAHRALDLIEAAAILEPQAVAPPQLPAMVTPAPAAATPPPARVPAPAP